MKYSMKRQFACIFIGLMSGTILLCWFINNTLLEKYYLANKKEAIYTVYDSLNNSIHSDNIFTNNFLIELNKTCGKYNISAMLMDRDSQVSVCVGAEKEVMQQALLDNIFKRGVNRQDLDMAISEDGSRYILQNVLDRKSGVNYLEMWGVLENGNFFMLRSSVESIRESVAIANRFLAYVGIAAAIASGIIIWYVSGKVTEPILQLTDISEQMIHLDFDAKYSGKVKTEVALLGENINKLSEALEKTISELKTANNELKKDIENKNKTDEMRKEFLSNVSHELKTPIALIQGYAEGLHEQVNDDAENREFYCEVIMDEASKMNIMVQKLMTLNELEFGNDNITMERFDIISLIKNYIQSASILTGQNNIKVRMDEYPPTFVWADEFKTEEVFMNYFTNAVNHASGDKIIDVKLSVKEKSVRISVVNTGEPIPGESLEHIWDKFYKVDKARTREYGGSGVGLSIVKAIMNSMNQQYGVINYENGVEFWFELDTVKTGEAGR